MMSIRRYYILTEIEGCKREEIRKVLKKWLKKLSLCYLLIAVFSLTFGCLAFNGCVNPDLTEVEVAKCGTALICVGSCMLMLIALLIDSIYGIWREPTERETEELGDRIV